MGESQAQWELSSRANIDRIVALERFRKFASGQADVLSRVPIESLNELRERTVRHKKNEVLCKNIQRILFAINREFSRNGSVIDVPFTAEDARLKHQIANGLWDHFVSLRLATLGHNPLITVYGLTVITGESGRTVGGTSRPAHQRLAPTTVSLVW